MQCFLLGFSNFGRKIQIIGQRIVQRQLLQTFSASGIQTF
ncbi:hypothetical protein YPPY99_4699, partial [Yersinia pestis PY-99]